MTSFNHFMCISFSFVIPFNIKTLGPKCVHAIVMHHTNHQYRINSTLSFSSFLTFSFALACDFLRVSDWFFPLNAHDSLLSCFILEKIDFRNVLTKLLEIMETRTECGCLEIVSRKKIHGSVIFSLSSEGLVGWV